MSRWDGVADPDDDERWRDRDLRPSGSSRVEPSCLAALALAGVVSLLGLALAVATVTLWLQPGAGGAIAGVLIALSTAVLAAGVHRHRRVGRST